MLPMTFENMLGKPFGSFNTALPIFYDTLSQVLALTVIPGALIGFVGAIVAVKKIKIPVGAQVVQETPESQS